jgi:hypothetical protein
MKIMGFTSCHTLYFDHISDHKTEENRIEYDSQ